MIQPLAIKAGNAIAWTAKEEDIQAIRNLLTETARAEVEAKAELTRIKQALYLADQYAKEAENERINVQKYLIDALTSLAEQEAKAARGASNQ